MLAADILGFHTRYHCQNFLATVDRFLECQIDHEHMTVTLGGRVCRVVPYPISIEWPPRWLATLPDVKTSRESVRARHGIGSNVCLGLGVERWDFTKGIVERFFALEALLDKDRGARGRITLLQVAAPTRSKLPAYQALQTQTLSEAARINEKFGTDNWKPIILIDHHQEPREVFELFRAADFCIVNSLHDGMNLVAKEFVAARDDQDGVLILSTFAGASRELPGGLAGQSVRCLRNRRSHAQRDADGSRRAARAHEADASNGEGKQRLSLGRQDAHGRGSDAPASVADQVRSRTVRHCEYAPVEAQHAHGLVRCV